MESGQVLLSGMMSGVIQTIVGFPLDTLTVWKQNKRKSDITFANLYKGIKYPLIQNPILCGSGFFFNDYFSKVTNNYVVSSFYTGIINSTILTPFDYYKINRQQNLPTNVLQSFNKVHIVSMREIPANVLYFNTYKTLRRYDIPIEISGGCAGVASWLFTYPIDTIKTRIQSDHTLSIRDAYRKGALFSGLLYCNIRAFIVSAIGFKVFETLKNY